MGGINLKIYTGRGDYGNTNLIGGRTVTKDDVRVDAYGTVDELNAIIGLAVTKAEENEFSKTLLQVQSTLFDVGTDLANDRNKVETKLTENHIKWLEEVIDSYTARTPETSYFVLPGGSELASILHLARTVCRRAERLIVTMMREYEVNEYAFRYMNRLSDFLFAMGRLVNHEQGVDEIKYTGTGEVFHND